MFTFSQETTPQNTTAPGLALAMTRGQQVFGERQEFVMTWNSWAMREKEAGVRRRSRRSLCEGRSKKIKIIKMIVGDDHQAWGQFAWFPMRKNAQELPRALKWETKIEPGSA